MPPSVLESIIELLDSSGVEYRHIRHEPTPTSADAARVRGEPLEIGGKALLIKAGDAFHLFVLCAALKLDSAAAKRQIGAKKSRFARPDELLSLTGLVPGSVPPFGEPILPFPLYVDRTVLRNDRIAFNAGSLTDSIIMSMADYRHVARITAEVEVAC